MGKWELLPTVLKANGECQVKLEEESDDSIWEGLQQGKGGVKIWLLVQTERSLSETFNKMQNFRRVGFHSLLYVNLETPRKAPHQLLRSEKSTGSELGRAFSCAKFNHICCQPGSTLGGSALSSAAAQVQLAGKSCRLIWKRIPFLALARLTPSLWVSEDVSSLRVESVTA